MHGQALARGVMSPKNAYPLASPFRSSAASVRGGLDTTIPARASLPGTWLPKWSVDRCDVGGRLLPTISRSRF